MGLPHKEGLLGAWGTGNEGERKHGERPEAKNEAPGQAAQVGYALGNG